MFRAVVIASIVVELAFGLGLVLTASTLFSMYALSTDVTTLQIARLQGAELLGYGVLSLFLLTQLGSRAVQRGLIFGGILSSGVGFVVTLLDRLNGIGNEFSWSVVGIYLVLALAYLFFLIRPPHGD